MEECIRWAYDVKEYQIAGPTWLNSDHASYDIEAKAPPETSKSEMRLMLQKLLADRFKLALHREERMLPVYNLLLGKGELKLKPSSVDGHHRTQSNGSHTEGHGVTLADIAYRFLRVLNRPVFDKTGLTGTFDFTIDYAPEGHDDSGQPSLFTAVQQQLGLKPEATKVPLEVLVIEHGE